MKRTILASLLIGLFSFVYAEDKDEYMPPYFLESSEQDPNLLPGQSVFEFRFTGLVDDGRNRIIYSIDGVADTVILDGNIFEVQTTPGNHVFQIYYNDNYQEIYTTKLPIKDQYRDVYRLELWDNYYNEEVDKPVIYLYPEVATKMFVEMDIKGEVTFTYPTLDKYWEFIAHPNGDLEFGDKTYNYLFWESHQKRYLNHVEMKSGFVVEKDNVVKFLEEKLTLAGLTSKEKADFITYWGPRLATHDRTFVRFEFNEQCNRYAELDISPAPDQLYRIYITWKPIYTDMSPSPQDIKTIDRKGFTVVEWGGFESSTYQSN